MLKNERGELSIVTGRVPPLGCYGLCLACVLSFPRGHRVVLLGHPTQVLTELSARFNDLIVSSVPVVHTAQATVLSDDGFF